MKLLINNILLAEILDKIIDKRKRTKRKLSPNQRAARERFMGAVKYANLQMADAAMRALYHEKITKKKMSAYTVAMTDALTPPKVKDIDTSDYYGAVGNIITIKAVDDFKVVRVSVIIKNNVGEVIESGDAVEDETYAFEWHYTATVKNPSLTGTTVAVTAFDYPRNQATLEKTCEHIGHPPSPRARKRVSGPRPIKSQKS